MQQNYKYKFYDKDMRYYSYILRLYMSVLETTKYSSENAN